MSPGVQVIRRDEPIRACAQLMRDHDVGFVPVCETDGTVVGACTDRDIVVRCIADGMDVGTSIDTIMTADVVCCSPDDDVKDAAKLLAQRQVSRLIVVDHSRRCVGVISIYDLAKAEKRRDVGKVVDKIKEDRDEDLHA